MKKQIEVFDYANDILKAVKTGVLLTTNDLCRTYCSNATVWRRTCI